MIESWAQANHRRWADREALRLARAAIDVRFLTVREAMAELNMSLDTAQKLLDWQGNERRQSERRT